MTLWRLEWLRMARTRRWIAPVAVHALFGLLGPVTERYLAEIIAGLGGIEVVLPDPTPAGGFTQYVSNVSQLGVLAVVVVSASSLAVDQPPEMGMFLRTRVRSAADLVVPRVVVVSIVSVAAWIIGALAAWYETVVLLGEVSPAAVIVGTTYGAVYLAFVVALLAALAALGRSTVATVLVGVGVLAVLPIIALLPTVERWVPSELVGALDSMVAGAPLDGPVPAAATAVVAGGALIAFAVRRVAAREA
ncbi:hypothetical protein [Euzebya rosea]|uniref:hypothetical protein n=1 Tax=Euzebya rosea TaxID=2052804 RepID=UPI000D3EC19F|nr:hypothetical protein [Euzebya rosea]